MNYWRLINNLFDSNQSSVQRIQGQMVKTIFNNAKTLKQMELIGRETST